MKLHLEEPTIERKQEALEYLDEFVKFNSPINGMGVLDKCLDGMTYEEFLEESKKREDVLYATSINRSPSKAFFCIRDEDNKMVGMINLRYQISEELIKKGVTHIGYSIRPTERRKGYNKIQLYLGLIEILKLGEENILLDCTVDNEGSNKSILALGGILERCEVDPNDSEMTNYYSINVLDSINEYKDEFEKYIDVDLSRSK